MSFHQILTRKLAISCYSATLPVICVSLKLGLTGEALMVLGQYGGNGQLSINL